MSAPGGSDWAAVHADMQIWFNDSNNLELLQSFQGEQIDYSHDFNPPNPASYLVDGTRVEADSIDSQVEIASGASGQDDTEEIFDSFVQRSAYETYEAVGTLLPPSQTLQSLTEAQGQATPQQQMQGQSQAQLSLQQLLQPPQQGPNHFGYSMPRPVQPQQGPNPFGHNNMPSPFQPQSQRPIPQQMRQAQHAFSSGMPGPVLYSGANHASLHTETKVLNSKVATDAAPITHATQLAWEPQSASHVGTGSAGTEAPNLTTEPFPSSNLGNSRYIASPYSAKHHTRSLHAQSSTSGIVRNFSH